MRADPRAFRLRRGRWRRGLDPAPADLLDPHSAAARADPDADAYADPDPHADPPPTPTSTNYISTEYNRSNGAISSKAISAWQAGATGAGVKLAVVDSGINPALAEFAGRIDPASRDVAGSRGVSDEDGHGTAVTATAAGARNDAQNLGVAFDATILSFRADTPGSCAETGEDKGCTFCDNAIAAGNRRRARGRGQGHQPVARR